MIDDRETCDVCEEEFNETRPHHKHTDKNQHKHKRKPALKIKSKKSTLRNNQ